MKHKGWHWIRNIWGTTTTVAGNEATGQLKFTEVCFCGEILREELQEQSFYVHKIENKN